MGGGKSKHVHSGVCSRFIPRGIDRIYTATRWGWLPVNGVGERNITGGADEGNLHQAKLCSITVRGTFGAADLCGLIDV